MPCKLAIKKSDWGCGNKKSRQELENVKNKILYFYLFDWLELQSDKNSKKRASRPFSYKFHSFFSLFNPLFFRSFQRCSQLVSAE